MSRLLLLLKATDVAKKYGTGKRTQKVKVTRGGKTFYRQQTVGSKKVDQKGKEKKQVDPEKLNKIKGEVSQIKQIYQDIKSGKLTTEQGTKKVAVILKDIQKKHGLAPKQVRDMYSQVRAGLNTADKLAGSMGGDAIQAGKGIANVAKDATQSTKASKKDEAVKLQATKVKSNGAKATDIETIMNHPDLSSEEKRKQLTRLQSSTTRKKNKKAKEKGFEAQLKQKIEQAKENLEKQMLKKLDEISKDLNKKKK